MVGCYAAIANQYILFEILSQLSFLCLHRLSFSVFWLFLYQISKCWSGFGLSALSHIFTLSLAGITQATALNTIYMLVLKFKSEGETPLDPDSNLSTHIRLTSDRS